MVKTPRTRHSKTERDPVTIELGPDDVSRVAPDAETGAPESGIQTDDPKEDIGASGAPSESMTGSRDVDTMETTAEAAMQTPESPVDEPQSTNKAHAAPNAVGREPRQGETATPGPRPASRQPSQPSRWSALGAGLAGGIVALAAAGLLQYAGLIGAPRGADRGPGISAAVETEIAGLKSEIDALKAGTGAPADIGGVTDRVDGLSQALDQVKSDMGALRESVESGAGGSPDLGGLNAKIAEIETRIAAIGPGSEGATPEEMAALDQRIAGVESLAKAATDSDANLHSRIGALEQSVSLLSSQIDAQAGQPKIALAIAASALKSAIERGSPFEPEVETFAAIAPDAPGLGELRTYAAKGVATRADIIAETDAAAKAIIASANPPPEDAGFFERLLSSAESMVTVRPIGEVEGPGVPETVARMEVALQAGDLAKAIAEFDTLPERARRAGAVFAEKIRARLAAEQLADQAIAAAMQAS